jgi:integral membrane protein (TIGR01906 family)
MSRKRLASGFTAFASSLLVVVLVLLNALVSVHLMAMDLGFYRTTWVACRVPQDSGMSVDELLRAGSALTGYFRGASGTPQIEAVIDGRPRPLYSKKELVHLEDVRSLFNTGFLLERVLSVATLAGVLCLLPLKRRRALARVLMIAAGVSLALLAALAIPAKTDFSGLWTGLHLVTFSNDLWMLDPATDWLIRMFPEEFFYSSVERIGLSSAGISAFYLASGLLVRYLSADHRH